MSEADQSPCVGNAQVLAEIVQAIATQQAVEFVGMPEARIPLAHATVYMCRAKKNREAYESLGAASEEIEKEKTRRVPEELKNKHFPVNPL
jgi:putative ATPase